ncbi:MAG: alpha/beta hydrolase [Candidatus Dojkabacteria bacterium]|nr:alpha/beta hydrolase [Candidatus Dojkabacteria bacterium]
MSTVKKVILNSGIEVYLRGEINNPGKIKIFVHGFGSNETGGSLVSKMYPGGFSPELANQDEANLVVSFNACNVTHELTAFGDREVQRFPSLSEYAEMLNSVISEVSQSYSDLDIHLIGHSLGTLAILKLMSELESDIPAISRISLLALPVDASPERMRRTYESGGRMIKVGDEYHILRTDGSVTIVTEDFWKDQEKINVLDSAEILTKRFAENLEVIVASKDTVLFPEQGFVEEI